MLIRRTLLVASMVVLLWAAPAHAQTYGGTLGEGQEQAPTGATGVVAQGTPTEVTGEGASGGLARTGADNITPMVEGAIALLGAGSLLVAFSRRRRTARPTLTA